MAKCENCNGTGLEQGVGREEAQECPTCHASGVAPKVNKPVAKPAEKPKEVKPQAKPTVKPAEKPKAK